MAKAKTKKSGRTQNVLGYDRSKRGAISLADADQQRMMYRMKRQFREQHPEPEAEAAATPDDSTTPDERAIKAVLTRASRELMQEQRQGQGQGQERA
jgi:hypothetical protein